MPLESHNRLLERIFISSFFLLNNGKTHLFRSIDVALNGTTRDSEVWEKFDMKLRYMGITNVCIKIR